MGRNQERVWLEEVVAGGAKEQNRTGTSCARNEITCVFAAETTQGATTMINAETPRSDMISKHQFALEGSNPCNRQSNFGVGGRSIFGGQIETEDTEVSFDPKFRPINPKLPYHTYTTYLHAYLAPVAWNMPQLCSQGNI